MSLTVRVPEELSRRLEAVAAGRGVSAEQVALEAIQERLGTVEPSRKASSFIGIGASGRREPAGRRHREIIREHFSDKAARDA